MISQRCWLFSDGKFLTCQSLQTCADSGHERANKNDPGWRPGQLWHDQLHTYAFSQPVNIGEPFTQSLHCGWALTVYVYRHFSEEPGGVTRQNYLSFSATSIRVDAPPIVSFSPPLLCLCPPWPLIAQVVDLIRFVISHSKKSRNHTGFLQILSLKWESDLFFSANPLSELEIWFCCRFQLGIHADA